MTYVAILDDASSKGSTVEEVIERLELAVGEELTLKEILNRVLFYKEDKGNLLKVKVKIAYEILE